MPLSVDPLLRVPRQTHLLTDLTSALGARKGILTAVPRMNRFPALPQPLAWILEQQAARLDQGLQRVASSFSQARHLSPDLPDDPALAAPDGYHPSPKTYGIRAEEIFRLIHQD